MKKNKLVMLSGLAIAALLLAYMVMFQVRFDQIVIVTTFGRAGESSVKTEPGLYFRFPDPIQSVHIFPKRVQVLENQLHEMPLADRNNVIIRTVLKWRIDPAHALEFFTRFPDYRPDYAAPVETQLRSFLGDMAGIVSRYSFNNLVNQDPAQFKQAQMEKETLDRIRSDVAGGGYGIIVEAVEITRTLLPQTVASKVFDAMIANRQKTASTIEQEGQARARKITDEASAIAKRITAFAQSRASAIRAQGDSAAAAYYPIFAANEELAIFLRKIEALRQITANKPTIILDASQLSPLDLLIKPPTVPQTSTPK